jgi:hypothetical protein
MTRLIINNLVDLKVFQTKLKILEKTLPTLQKQAMEKTANEDVLSAIKKRMKQHSFSPKIIDATFVGPIEQFGNVLRYHIISNYVAENGFDVSSAREEGTRDHVVLPKKENGILRWYGAGNKPIFRRSSRPRGIQRLLIIERTIKELHTTVVANFQKNLSDLITRFLGV